MRRLASSRYRASGLVPSSLATVFQVPRRGAPPPCQVIQASRRGRDGAKGEDLGAKTRRLKLVREVVCEGLGKPGVRGEKRTHARSRDGKRARRGDGHAVAVVARGEHGRLRENRVREGPLQHEGSPVRAVPDEVRLAGHHEVEHRDLVTAAKDGRAGGELSFRRVEAVKSIEEGHEPDSYHVSAARVQARCTGADLGACT